jgi:hypothetical protein
MTPFPRHWGRSIRGFAVDLEAVVGKALEKERKHRHQTAQALADDLNHVPNGQSISIGELAAISKGASVDHARGQHSAGWLGR